MPWKERTALEQRKQFLDCWRQQQEPVAELCRQFEISRPTAYKWIERYQAGGEAALEEGSRAPHHHPQAMSAAVIEQLLQVRQKHPRWGPRKIRAYLERRDPKLRLPAPSSIGELLHREGLSHPRHKRQRTPACAVAPGVVTAPNDLWCTDFKGWFVCGDGQRCDPLTISDAHSRYLLRCRVVEATDGPHVRAVFEAVFREYGMPYGMRSDNGAPFASPAPGGLSRLSIWWMRLGVKHERIHPGCPQENGQHERMHETLKQETASPPSATLRQQQEALVRFEREYNLERPHEALGYRTPAEVYTPSPRGYPAKLPEWEYPEQARLRRIGERGQFKWGSQKVFLSSVLDGEVVGFLEQEEDFYEVYLGSLLLGWFDASGEVFVADRGPGRASEDAE